MGFSCFLNPQSDAPLERILITALQGAGDITASVGFRRGNICPPHKYFRANLG